MNDDELVSLLTPALCPICLEQDVAPGRTECLPCTRVMHYESMSLAEYAEALELEGNDGIDADAVRE